MQKLPVFTLPHEHVQPASGFFEPQLGQKLPVFTLPHEHVHDPAADGAAI